MIGTLITIKNHDTGKTIVLNDHADKENVIALQSFPSFETEVRAQNVPRMSAHGEMRLPYYYSGKPIVLAGLIAGENESKVWEIKRLFDEVMALSREGFAKQTESEDILPAFAVNLCTNPRGKVSAAGWSGTDAIITADGGIKAEAEEATVAEALFDVPGAEGQSMSVALDIRNESGGDRTFQLALEALDSGDSTIDYSTFDTRTLSPDEAARFHVSHTLPAGTASVRIHVQRLPDDGEVGDVFVIDRVFAIADAPSNIDPATSYFDGDSPALSRVRYEWTGTPGLSTSEAIRRSFPSMSRNTIRVSFIDPLGRNMFLDATPVKSVSYDRPIQQKFLLNWQVILRADFPFFIVDDATTPIVFNGQLGSIDQGFKVPFQIPFSLGTKFIENEMVIHADSPQFTIVHLRGSDDGIIVNPRITNLTNGTGMSVMRSLLGAERSFTIDGIYQNVYDENGKGQMPYTDGDFVFLDEGENRLIYTADNLIPN